MEFGRELSAARRRLGLTQRELAVRAGTSQATISAYEAGQKQPSVATAQRLLGAAGAELSVAALPGGRTTADLERAGRVLAEVIGLAEALPFRAGRTLRYPRLPAT